MSEGVKLLAVMQTTHLSSVGTMAVQIIQKLITSTLNGLFRDILSDGGIIYRGSSVSMARLRTERPGFDS
jgi:hypothetical protein